MSISRTWPQIYPNKNHLDPETWNKVGSYVPRKDWQLINSVIGQSGGISHIIDHAIKHTADVIRTNNLSFIDRDEFVKYICERMYTPFRAPVTVSAICEQPSPNVGIVPVEPNKSILPDPPKSGKGSRTMSDRRKRLVETQRKRTET